MNGRLQNAIQSLKQNKGSSIVMVVITMLFVMVLGSILLFTTYTGVLVKSAERRGEQNFYDAQTAMTIVRTGIQEAVNASIVKSYPEVLVNFSALNSTGEKSLTEIFHEAFKKNLFAYEFEELETKNIFIANDTTTLYSYRAIEDYFIYATGIEDLESEGLSFPLSSLATAGELEISDVDKTITLKDFKITHTQESTGVTTSVQTDIVVNMPEFEYNYTPYVVSSIPEFAFVVGDTLNTYGTTTINGSLYAGSINLQNENLSLNAGTIICGGGVSLTNSTLTVGENVDMWSNEISMDTSNLNLDGTSYVYDDLLLDKENNVVVNGTYIGYNDDIDTASESSAILVNGINNTLNLEGVDELILAGRGFVGGYGGYNSTANTGAGTGESLAVKSNQIAYLIPVGDLVEESGASFTNPHVFDINDALPTLALSAEAVTKYEKYNLTSTSLRQEVHHLDGDTYIAYYFFDFPTVEDAVSFFEDYYNDETNNEILNTYMNTYFEELGGAPVATTYASGVLFNEPSLDEFELLKGQTITDYSRFSEIYDHLTQTLSADKSSSEGVYEYIVDGNAVRDFMGANTTMEFRNAAGEIVALLVNTDYVFTSSEDIPLIVAHPDFSGTITVNTDFDGLIITDGSVLVSGSLTVNSNSQAVREALLATNNGTAIGDFLSFASGEEQHESYGTGAWNLDELVDYDNWSKSNS